MDDSNAVNTTFTFSKLEIINMGISELTDVAMDSMRKKVSEKLTRLVCENLKEADNTYQIIVEIKRVDK